jgi:hypothetical protein
MLSGDALSIEITPVAVRLPILEVGVAAELASIPEVMDSGGERDGQHSGLSSLQPTSGTSMTAPSCRASPVY